MIFRRKIYALTRRHTAYARISYARTTYARISCARTNCATITRARTTYARISCARTNCARIYCARANCASRFIIHNSSPSKSGSTTLCREDISQKKTYSKIKKDKNLNPNTFSIPIFWLFC